eukprot:TRINITY_DN6498_c0_g1_i1.p1 TRINITY_DN6498_c0_g1~~TRINITY_DN6498_c0_g1_i1.p1  ORF type:complete len:390 (+),score=149.02 TRINITY_DN6498_c0_g1_i1:120-1289(+)
MKRHIHEQEELQKEEELEKRRQIQLQKEIELKRREEELRKREEEQKQREFMLKMMEEQEARANSEKQEADRQKQMKLEVEQSAGEEQERIVTDRLETTSNDKEEIEPKTAPVSPQPISPEISMKSPVVEEKTQVPTGPDKVAQLEAEANEKRLRVAALTTDVTRKGPVRQPSGILELSVPYNPMIFFRDPLTLKPVKYKIIFKSTSFGRKSDNDVVLQSKYISRNQARIELQDIKGEVKCVWKGLGSSSGTKINGVRVSDQPVKKGDQIKIGKTLLIFVDETDEPFLVKAKIEGPGYKAGNKIIKNWQSRYFVLQGHVIYYFKNQKERNSNGVPERMIDLDGTTIVKEDKSTFSLDVDDKIVNLKFPEKEKDKWTDVIRRVLSKMSLAS